MDLAIGVPEENLTGPIPDAGAVNVLYGSAAGLTSTGDQFWNQDSTGVNDGAEAGDEFGFSLAAANLGGSSQADLAIGEPFENVGAIIAAGGVNVLYGSATGLTASGNQFWTQDSAGVLGTAEDGDALGWSLAAANLGKSSQSDLAIGAPFEDLGAIHQGGAVNVLYGSSTGLTSTGDQLWSQDSTGVNGTAEAGDWFGFSLAATNLGKSSEADLAIGVTFEDVGALSAAGAVNVLYGSSSGLSATGDQLWTQDSSGIQDTAEAGDSLVWSVSAANYGHSTQADLAIGAPGETVGGDVSAGAVNVLYGSSTGLSSTGDQFWKQDSTGISGDGAQAGDGFGAALPGSRFIEVF